MARLSVFISYSRRDQVLRRELVNHLDTLVKAGAIDCWDDQRIGAGEEWDPAIRARLRSAGLVLLLVSDRFLESPFCQDETREALERQQAGHARVVPILVRKCRWQQAALARLNPLPRDGRPVADHRPRSEAWKKVVGEIAAVVGGLREAPVQTSLVDMVLVPGGSFEMGKRAGTGDERPVQLVEVPALQIGRYPVTQKQYRAVMDTSPGALADDDVPVSNVTWLEAVLFCNHLSARERLRAAYDIRGQVVRWDRGAEGYRLPTEAEWEYGARGTDGRPYPWGDEPPAHQLCWNGPGNDVGFLGRVGPSRVGSHPAGASPFGLQDMAGNVAEWCWDRYPVSTPEEVDLTRGDERRVVRGGSFSDVEAAWVCATERVGYHPMDRLQMVGLRCVRGAR